MFVETCCNVGGAPIGQAVKRLGLCYASSVPQRIVSASMANLDVNDQPSLNEADIRRQLERILAYPELQASGSRRDMLRHIVEEALAGRSSQIKATTIAMAVFERGPDFDQQSDPVVRLEARKLRRDLDNYYAGAGREDPIRIAVPKGGLGSRVVLAGGRRGHACHPRERRHRAC